MFSITRRTLRSTAFKWHRIRPSSKLFLNKFSIYFSSIATEVHFQKLNTNVSYSFIHSYSIWHGPDRNAGIKSSRFVSSANISAIKLHCTFVSAMMIYYCINVCVCLLILHILWEICTKLNAHAHINTSRAETIRLHCEFNRFSFCAFNGIFYTLCITRNI